MSSISPEEAVARAKAIAAKLSGGGAADTSSTVTVPANGTLDPNAIALAAQAALESALGGGGSKRKRWGVPGDDTNDSSKKLKEATHSKRIWVSTETKPPSHFAAYFATYPTDLDAILSQAPGVTIELKGRGSHSSTVLPGMPEEPMHIMIEGDDIEAVTLAESLMEGLMNKVIEHELLVDEHAVANNGHSDLALTGHAVTMLEEQIGVPNGVVGFIIGRGGESITSMQARTGCKVQMQKEHDMAPGAQMRVITLQATTKEAIDACREIIQGMVQERIKTTHSSSTFGQAAPPVNPQDSKLQEALQAGHVLVEIKVPDTDVGLIIGKSGVTIRGIQDRSGANIQIPQSGDPDDPSVRTVSITHAHAEGAALARQLIDDLLSTKKEHVPFLNMQVEIPDKDVGMCIGRSGCVVREMQNKSGCKIQIPSQSTPGALFRIATVNGPQAGCQMVKQMIERIILEQSSQSVMSGTGYDNGGAPGAGFGGQAAYGQQHGGAAYGGGYGQHQAAYGQQTGYGGQADTAAGGAQGDYSAEWAAYYAAQAAAAAAPAAAAPAPAGQQGADAYYEQFHRYAYYYGEPAARQYYGAWSPPVGTPNPYGTNPSGITAPPDAAPAPAAAAPAAAPVAAAPAARDTGRRGVSNLPAWMTKGN